MTLRMMCDHCSNAVEGPEQTEVRTLASADSLHFCCYECLCNWGQEQTPVEGETPQ